MDAPVVAAIVSSAVALVVAVGTAVATTRTRRTERGSDRVRADLLAAQEAVLAFRAALAEYGIAFGERARQGGADRDAVDLEVPAALDRDRAHAQSQFEVALARVTDRAVADALLAWAQAARFGLLDRSEPTAGEEQAAFDAVNRAIGAALRDRK